MIEFLCNRSKATQRQFLLNVSLPSFNSSLLLRHVSILRFWSATPFVSIYFAFIPASIFGIFYLILHPKDIRSELVHLLNLSLQLFLQTGFVEVNLVDENKQLR